MSPEVEAAAQHAAETRPPPSPSSRPPPSPSSRPGLRKLASKPLKIAASTFRPRSLSRGNSAKLVSLASSSSTSTLVPTSSAGDINEAALSEASSSRPRRRRRGLRLKAHRSQNAMDPAHITSVARGPRKPLDGEEPAAVLRVRVVKAEGLVAMDRNGTSDPFISLVIPPSSRQSTPVVKKSLNPVFPATSSTFDFPLYLSLAGLIGGRGIEGVVWDKDLMRKEYMGEFSAPVDSWFHDGEIRLWHENLPVTTQRLLSTRRRHRASGEVSLQIGFVPPRDSRSSAAALEKLKKVFGAFVTLSDRVHAGVLGVPAHEGIGTIKMRTKSSNNGSVVASKDMEDDEDLSSALGEMYEAVSGLKITDESHVNSLLDRMINHVRGDGHGDDDLSDVSDSDSVIADDGLSTSSDEEYEDALEDDASTIGTRASVSPLDEKLITVEEHQRTDVPPPKTGDVSKSFEDRVPRTAGLLAPTPRPLPSRQSSLPGYFDRQSRSDRTDQGDDLATPTAGPSVPPTPSGMTTPGGSKRRPIFNRQKSQTPSRRGTRDYHFDAAKGKEVLGIVVMEIQKAEDLPRIKNSLRVSFDMDPFVVIAFGQKVFRTRVIRHSLNPTWDEKLLFHVRRHESTYLITFSVLDWDKVSGNDMVGTCTLPLTDLVADAPKPNADTGLYQDLDNSKHAMREFTLPLSCDKDLPWESKHSPKITFRAKFQPYSALRQKFWRQYLNQYDADDTETISHTELTTMLDSLGSTLTRKTIESFFTKFDKSPDKDELTMDEAVQCLEYEVTKARSEKAKVGRKHDSLDMITENTSPNIAPYPAKDGLDVSGPQGNISTSVDAQELTEHIIKSKPREQSAGQGTGNLQEDHSGNFKPMRPDNLPAVIVERSRTSNDDNEGANGNNEHAGVSLPDSEASSAILASPAYSEPEDLDGEPDSALDDPLDDLERIINIRTCPLCHRRRLGKRSEQDIVTHLAICASSDWSRVDRIVTANYVTSSQAQRKFFTRMVNKVAIGAYSLGANSANILVQDRQTGQLQEEKMAVYVRLGIRVLYKGARSRMEGARARRLLRSLSVKQGLKYNSPASVVDIPTFIAFHNLDVTEIRDPINSFKTFNQFFYRKLKPDARPVAEPGNDARLVSCADCRMMAFETVNVATSIWIKGREFSVKRLLGPNYANVAGKFDGGALSISRLAPQDYHRFHSPVKGKVGKMTMIDGEYYTVNPQAIRTSLDVYGENVRKIVPIETEDFGLVMTVWVGAMMVGSILTSVEEGQTVERGEELGYFAFGGSTIVCLFEKGSVQWDQDLLDNGKASIETLVRMGSGIGSSTKGKERNNGGDVAADA